MKLDLSNFDSDPLNCDLALFPAKNNTNRAKSNRIFPRIKEEDRNLILTYLNSLMAEVFPSMPSLGGNRRSKLQKCKLWVLPLFHKNTIPSKKFSNNVYVN